MDDSRLNKIFNVYSKKEHSQWRHDLLRSIDEDTISGIKFPTFPSAELQRHLQGNSNAIAIRGALAFRDYCVQTAAALNTPFNTSSVLLDFGTRWGRIARAFMSDIPATKIFAVDPFDFIIEARKNNPYISFIHSDSLPPLPLRDGFVSHLATWSTFSHFNKDYFDSWIQEFGRIMKPGGLCFISTLGVKFIEQLENARQDQLAGVEPHFWIGLILKRIGDLPLENVIATISEGCLYWLPSSQVARQEFAECFVTDVYFRKSYDQIFEVVAYADKGELAQDCIVLRRRY